MGKKCNETKDDQAGDFLDKLLNAVVDDPVEFRLPEWLNSRRKPTSFTLIKRNVYLTKKMKRRSQDDGIFCSCSSSSGSAVCDKDCLCGILLSTCSRSCRCGVSCINRPFQSRPAKKVKLIETQKCGSGLVADEDIWKGEFVIEYVGEVIDDKVCEERLWKMKHRGQTNFYLCEISRDIVIDATYKGNKSRFINHSCQPNTEMQKWTIDGETRIGIYSTRHIKRGEELTYDYQFVQFGADQDCHCGATGCRRMLGNKPNKSDVALKLVRDEIGVSSSKFKANMCKKDDFHSRRSETATSEISAPNKPEKWISDHNCVGKNLIRWCNRNKRYYGEVILEFNCYTKKHMIINDEGVISYVDLSKEEWYFLPHSWSYF